MKKFGFTDLGNIGMAKKLFRMDFPVKGFALSVEVGNELKRRGMGHEL